MNDLTVFNKINCYVLIPVLALILVFCSLQVQATGAKVINQPNPGFKLEQVAQGLGLPWGMAFLGDQELIFTEREGDIKILDLDSLEITTLEGAAEVDAEGQGGMLDVATGPDYATQDWIFFTYSKSTISGAVTTLARARRKGIQLSDWQELLVTDSATSSYQHFGSRIAFDQQGHVFFGVGDRGERDNAQDLSSHAGTIMRLRLDGSIPDDNPFMSRANTAGWPVGD